MSELKIIQAARDVGKSKFRQITVQCTQTKWDEQKLIFLLDKVQIGGSGFIVFQTKEGALVSAANCATKEEALEIHRNYNNTPLEERVLYLSQEQINLILETAV